MARPRRRSSPYRRRSSARRFRRSRAGPAASATSCRPELSISVAKRASDSSSLPATRRRRSCPNAFCGRSLSAGCSSLNARSRPSALLVSLRSRIRSTWNFTNGTEASTRSRSASTPGALDQLGRIGSFGQRDDSQLQVPVVGDLGGAKHRLLAGAVGVETQHEHRRDALELVDLLLGQRGAHDPDRVATGPPGAARARRCSPRPGSRSRSAPRRPGRDRARTAPRACGRARPRRCSGTSVAGCRASRAPRSRSRCPRASVEGNMIRSRNRS